ncbi:MAG: hypothetical protein KR126chlam3_00003 [Chlamydiae bacterium]|nr:hypothetical protein [Chlamydiota bacterium]
MQITTSECTFEKSGIPKDALMETTVFKLTTRKSTTRERRTFEIFFLEVLILLRFREKAIHFHNLRISVSISYRLVIVKSQYK